MQRQAAHRMQEKVTAQYAVLITEASAQYSKKLPIRLNPQVTNAIIQPDFKPDYSA